MNVCRNGHENMRRFGIRNTKRHLYPLFFAFYPLHGCCKSGLNDDTCIIDADGRVHNCEEEPFIRPFCHATTDPPCSSCGRHPRRLVRPYCVS